MVFTLIFKEFGVCLTEEDFKDLEYSNYLNEGTLHWMKLEKRGDKWVKRKYGQEDMEREGEVAKLKPQVEARSKLSSPTAASDSATPIEAQFFIPGSLYTP